MGQLTLPSSCKSSVAVIWPLRCKLEPRRADARAGLPPTAGVDGFPKATTGGFAACAGAEHLFLARFLVPILSSPSRFKKLIPLPLVGSDLHCNYPLQVQCNHVPFTFTCPS